MITDLHDSFSDFDPIGLDELNAKAEMLARIDNKYILPAWQLAPALESFADMFDVLDIDGTRDFRYSTVYFDDVDLRGYYDHHQRRRKRLKARVRSYVDAGLHYLEVKLNDRRSTTLKKRLRLGAATSQLDAEALAFIDGCHAEVYGEPFRKQLSGAIHIRYRRYTLVAKDGGERMSCSSSRPSRRAATASPTRSCAACMYSPPNVSRNTASASPPAARFCATTASSPPCGGWVWRNGARRSFPRTSSQKNGYKAVCPRRPTAPRKLTTPDFCQRSTVCNCGQRQQ